MKIFIIFLLVSFQNHSLIQENKVYLRVDKSAEPKEGFDDWYAYIIRNLVYPNEAIRNNIEGKVYLKFIVNEDGTISEIEVKKGIGYGCDQEAIRIVSKSLLWNPGKVKDSSGVLRSVRQQIIFPLEFKLPD